MSTSQLVSRDILVADDSSADQEIIRLAFESTGFPIRLQMVDDGEEALSKLGVGPEAEPVRQPSAVLPRLPDLVLLDLNLPRLSGREVLKAIRSSERLRHLPVVILSGSARHDDVLWCYRHGCNGYVQKSEFRAFREDIQRMAEFWLKTALLPS
jgi:CheY-like chemotaxis protein